MLPNGLQLYRAHFGVILGLVLTIEAPGQFLLNYLVRAPEEPIRNFVAGALLHGIFGVLISGGILHALLIAKLDRRAGFPECLSAAFANWLQLVWTNMLAVMLIAAGFFVCLLPGLIALVRLSVANIVVITEGVSGPAALRRSVRLTADRSWKVIRLGVLLCFPLQIVAPLAARMLQMSLPFFRTWQMVSLAEILLTLAGALVTTCFFCLYEELVSEESLSA